MSLSESAKTSEHGSNSVRPVQITVQSSRSELLPRPRRIHRIRCIVAAFIGVSFLMQGCGLGAASSLLSDVNPLTTLVTLVILWQGRSRDISAPVSALSGTVVLKNGKSGGGDLTFTFDRDSNLAAHSQSITSSEPMLYGVWPATVTFYSDRQGRGSVVGIASKDVTIGPTGNIGDIATAGTISGVSVRAGQTIEVGKTQDLSFTATDANGAAISVSPGSVAWTVVTGKEFLSVSSNGQLVGVSPGSATVVATVDGRASLPVAVAVINGSGTGL